MNDKLYKFLLFAAALTIPLVCGGVVYALVTDAYGAFEYFGFFKFLTSSEWSYTDGAEQYGALPFITGTLMTTLLALLFCIPFSLPVALFVGEYLKEGAYSLGATRAEVIRKVVFPVAGSGIFSSYILAIGRALGETMTVTMLIGNTNNIPDSITSTGNSMASIIANQFGEADDLKLSSLIAIGLILFLITAFINLIGKIMIKRARIA